MFSSLPTSFLNTSLAPGRLSLHPLLLPLPRGFSNFSRERVLFFFYGMPPQESPILTSEVPPTNWDHSLEKYHLS